MVADKSTGMWTDADTGKAAAAPDLSSGIREIRTRNSVDSSVLARPVVCGMQIFDDATID